MNNNFLILYIGILFILQLNATAQTNYEPPENNPSFKNESGQDKTKLKLTKLIPYVKQNLWGYADSTGVIRVVPKYQYAEPIYRGVGRVMLNRLYGLVNEKGKEVLAPQFEKIEKFDGQLATVLLKGKQGVVNKEGKIIVPAIYSSALPLRDSYSKLTNYVVTYDYVKTGPDQVEVKQGAYKPVFMLFDAAGKEIGKNPYMDIKAIGDGLVRISVDKKSYSYINDKGDVIIKDIPYSADKLKDGIALVKDDSKKYGYMDRTGKLVIPIKYESANDFDNGYAVAKQNGKVGLINKQNDIIIPFHYQGLRAYPEDKVVLAWKDGKMGVLGIDGKTLVNFQYSQIKFDDKDKLFTLYSTEFISSEGKKGLSCAFLNQKQQLTFVEDVYIDYTDNLSDGIIKAKSVKDKKVGFIDKNGKTVIPFIYDDALPSKHGLVAVKKGLLYGLVNLQHKEVIPFQYGFLEVITPESFLMRIASPNKNSPGIYGLINKKGQDLAPTRYSSFEHLIDGKAVVRLNGQVGVINSMGKVVLPMTKLPAGYIGQGTLEQGIYTVHDTQGIQLGYADIYGRLYFSK